MNKKSEKELLEALAEGDRSAYKALFLDYYPKVKGFAYVLLKNSGDAEDMVQEIFLRIWTDRERLADVRNFGAYVHVLTRNAIYNLIESRQIKQNHLQNYEAIEVENVSAHDQLVAQDLSLLIEIVVSRMPVQRQTVYRMSRDEGKSNQEIAEQLGLSKKTVENHLNLALKTIREVVSIILLIGISHIL